MAKKLIKLSPKEQYTKLFLETAGCESSVESIEKNKSMFWYSYRDKNTGGLRLTDIGLNFINDEVCLKTYKIDLPKEFNFTPQTMIWLDQYLNTPFFIDKKSIIVISERAAFELYLFSGDIRKFGLSKSLSNRMTQD
jgi:hypothetical protein